MAQVEEFSLVDSLTKTGELKFIVAGDSLLWDGVANTVEFPARPDPSTIPRATFQAVINRVLIWESDIQRTVPPLSGEVEYEYESERKDDGEVIVKIKVDPSPQLEFSYDPTIDMITLVDARPDPILFPWNNWVKLNKLQVLMLDFIRFAIKP